MWANKRKKEEDRSEAYRQKVIAYKKVFSTPEGREVLFDLMDRYYLLNTTGGDPAKEGQRQVILDILTRTNTDLTQLDKILKGEYDGGSSSN